MKKLILMFLVLPMSSLNAKMVYDPVYNSIGTLPANKNINQSEYLGLWRYCYHNILDNIKNMNWNFSGVEVRQQFILYLKGVGTPTAFRLIEDFKDNHMYYPDGSVIRKLFNL